ncbi:uncharacterized protein A1O9_00945 [Exophiala aquamarina CBS 119918]|uniref:Anaphase-promoting complex subunit 1 N-terminal domain-containing protein n=1 Tax=Exophiala aquamarina CBS 119918 TaxID=1182545 RepID=A0A072Q4X8_9EURO|nr:uncharacterized protein A1O9_00945 [Exophiala aquamarina CBS 119918]KEF62970.1 hypothetical protein A1O9_00945 [Exophiala aquamarina CBS 119918]
MSSVQSLGLHEPSALPYLVGESILPADPSPSLYKWSLFHTPSDQGTESIEEEIVITGSCVVWSRNGLVKRTLNLDVEGEPILHAFVTDFKSGDHPSEAEKDSVRPTSLERGLVIVLKTQAHIFLLSGDTHVVPLSFEVESAFPFPFGFVLQRTLGEDELLGRNSLPALHHDLSTINETLTTIGGTSSRPSLLSPGKQNDFPKPLQSNTRGIPRTFSYTEVMSELGLVVWSPSRRGEPLDNCKALPRTEKIIFISPCSELGLHFPSSPPLSIALTLNETSSSFTLWHVTPETPDHPHGTQRQNRGSTRSRPSLRKSSNIYSREPGAVTPAARGSGHLRESLNAAAQNQPHGEGLFTSVNEEKSFPISDLASHLGPEFGDIGVQTRSARRVSSMLARTELGAGNDRNTFNDLAMGHPGRQSLNRVGRRGESIGSFNDRQSFGFRRRSSFPTNASMLSAGTSFLDLSARGLLDEFDPLHHSARLEDDASDGSDTNLPRDIGFFKVKNFSRSVGSESPVVDTDIKVLALSPHGTSQRGNVRATDLYICIIDKSRQEMILVKLLVKYHDRKMGKKDPEKATFEVKATDLRRLSGISDACKVQEGHIQRLVVLTQSRTQQTTLHLEAPWSPSYPIELVQSFGIFDPLVNTQMASPKKSEETGIRRIIPGNNVRVQALGQSGVQGRFYAMDQDRRAHTIQLHLRPKDPLIAAILQMCDIVSGTDQHEALLVAFWEVSRWLKGKGSPVASEWTTLVIVLFSLATPFISTTPQTHSHRRKKSALLRSSSGTAVDLTSYDAMHNDEHEIKLRSETRDPAWSWLLQKQPNAVNATARVKGTRLAPTMSPDSAVVEGKHNTFIVKCIALAKEYTQTPMGENAIGPEGYLPTSISKNREQRCNAVASILIGLHLLYEENKLTVSATSRLGSPETCLVFIMAQLGHWLGWKDWTCQPNTYYEFEASESQECLFELTLIDGLQMPSQPFEPPSIYAHLEDWINGNPLRPFLTLARVAGVGSQAMGMEDSLWQRVSALTPRTLALLSYMQSSKDQIGTQQTIHILSKAGIDKDMIKTFPDGIAAAIYQAIFSKRSSLNVGPTHDGKISQRLIPMIGTTSEFLHSPLHKAILMPNHGAVRDYHTICSSALEAETLQRWDASSEADRHAVTKLLFSEDRRFPEASRLVNQTRPPVVECTPEPDWTEIELLEAQKELAQHVTRRTLSVATGRGMMHFNARVPLLTERVPIPAFSLQCIMKSRRSTEGTQAMTFSADKGAFTEEKVCWAFFHNGASMGLMIANDAQGIDTSWILYNRPPELTNRHAGFLLALGLNGHLKSLAKWVAFKYLTPKHTMTSVGLILGLSVSFLGTMDTLITRLLSVHVTRLLPPGAAELNLSPLTQTTGIIGIGLLYCNSQHRRMSEVMLSEIENNDPEEGAAAETVLRDEGYRLAAGFSLGLINLGHGKHLHGLHDMSVVERLLAIAVGTKNVNMVHVLDRATAGAVMAMTFVFLKTNDESIARKVDVPDTLHQFDYVRPDVFLLRTLARHLIMWDSVKPTVDFIRASLPQPYHGRVDLKSTKFLSTEDMPFFNIVAGLCLAIGLRFAGSQRHDVRDLLIQYLDQFLRLSRLPARNYDARVTLNSTRNCLDTVALATAAVMAGSGDLLVMRRLRALHGRTDGDTPFGSHLAAHMALGALFLAGGTRTFGTSNLAVASLCMAFYPVFPNDVLDNRGHLQALRHLWVLAVEGRCLVAKDRADGSVIGGMTGTIQLKNGETRSLRVPGLVPELDTITTIEVKGEGFWDAVLDFSSPENASRLEAQIRKDNAVNVFISRRVAYDKPPQDLFAAEFQARSEASGIPSVDPNADVAPGFSVGLSGGGAKRANPFEWLFDLDSLKNFDHAERALVLQANTKTGNDAFNQTVVDTRLEFEKGILPQELAIVTSARKDLEVQKNKLWQLRLLFAWFDRWEKEDQEIQQQVDDKHDRLEASNDIVKSTNIVDNDDKWFTSSGGTYLRREVIERLRYRVWQMTIGEDGKDTLDI